MLVDVLSQGSKLAIAVNSNTGFVGEMYEFANGSFSDARYDFFDQELLDGVKDRVVVESMSFTTPLSCSSFDELAMYGWFLFGSGPESIGKESELFKLFLE